MVTKWRNFTARTAVKLVSFLLIIALSFIMLNSIYAIIYSADTERVSPEIVFSDLSDYQVFYNNHMNNAYYYAAIIAEYKSEASIIAGEHIEWEENASEYWDDDEIVYQHRLQSANGSMQYGWLDDDEYKNPEKRESAEQDAIYQQLVDFRKAQDILEGRYGDMYGTEGMLYFVTDTLATSGNIYTNVDVGKWRADYFKSQPVYIVTGEYGLVETSHTNAYQYYSYSYSADYSVNSGAVIYIAFDRETVDAVTAEYAAIKDSYSFNFAIIAVSGVLILAILVVLMSGAGRRRADNGEKVHFTILDKPYLDLGLVAAGFWIGFMIYLGIEFSWNISHYNNASAMRPLLAVMSVVIVPIALWWLLSLCKRMKAGRFWRHTLIYAVLNRCVKSIKSLWAGFPLTVKVAAIGVLSFFTLVLAVALGTTHEPVLIFFPLLALTAVIVFILLRYARRIHILEQGAQAASLGTYDTEINVGKGELGHIADSINNITAGINTAVEQRMKSERLKTELISNVSHDIRTPLTSIITYTDLLKHEGLGCEKAPEYLDVLIQKSQRLKTLTDELFEASKAATGNIDVNITELDLTALITQVLGELDGSIISSGLDLRVKLPERVFVRADGKLMWRVMENLLSNVFKYSLKNSRVYLDAERENGFVRVDLKNISATELNVDPSELTERFRRGDESRTDGGSGLGLSIVQSFVSAQGGRLALTIDGDLFKASVYLPAVNR